MKIQKGLKTLAYIALLAGVGCNRISPERKELERPVDIDVCVLNSGEFPASEERINSAMQHSINVFQRYANINLNVVEREEYGGNLSNVVFGNGPFLNPRASCKSPNDITVLFTNANNVGVRTSRGDGVFLNANAWPKRGYAVIYGRHSPDSENEHLHTTAHEIGHLLGLEDNVSEGVMNYDNANLDPNYSILGFLKGKGKQELLPSSNRIFPDSINP